MMSDAARKAREFLEREQAFRLGELLTESFHPKTRRLSQTMQADIEAGVRLLQAVDEDIPAALERIFAQETFGRLVEAFHEAMRSGRRIFFTGCGATGRLSILLEAAWREFWHETGQSSPHGDQPWRGRPALASRDHPGLAALGHDARATGKVQGQDALATPTAARMEDLCISIMAGGDFALIKSVEGFEDFPAFGRHQLQEAGVQRDDVVVAITEGGETSFVIGTAWQGLAVGAHVFFVYNNPTDLLRRHVQRSREVIDEPRIHKLDLATGPMAITGSTRMQATTAELLVVGAALEMALTHWVGCAPHTVSAEQVRSWRAEPTLQAGGRSPQEYHRLLEDLLKQLSSPEAVAAIARIVELEEQVYRKQGLVTYAVDSLMLDVLTDTTERSPTFMVPPFRRAGDATSPVSWAFVKNPHLPTPEAWRDMLQREPRGLTWGAKVYKQLNAPLPLQSNPPKLDNAEIYKFRIGSEPDPSRTDAPDSLLVLVQAQAQPSPGPAGLTMPPGVAANEDGVHGTPCPSGLPNHPSSIIHHQWKRTAAITFGPSVAPLDVDEHIHIPCDLPSSPLRLWEHLAIKLILNTLSTATMVRLGRVIGNAMVWVSPSNKKLIDRGCRLIMHQTGCTYEHACEVLHEAMDEITQRAQRGEEVPSPVALAIDRLTGRSQKSEV